MSTYSRECHDHTIANERISSESADISSLHGRFESRLVVKQTEDIYSPEMNRTPTKRCLLSDHVEDI